MILQWLAEEFAQHLGQALEMMSGEKVPITAEAPAEVAPAPGDLIREQPYSQEGTCAWLAGPKEAWAAVGASLLRAAGIEEHDEETARSTFIETLNHAFAALGREVGSRIQEELSPAVGSEKAEASEVRRWARIEVRGGDASGAAFLVAFSERLEQLLEAVGRAEERAQAKAPETRSGPAGIENSRTLELLLDVELPVSVSFGRAQLPVKDVIKLTTGSIVELNRNVGEPVEVIVNNCVIARGEVVVVEGNFGVRIQEVISKKERLRTLY
jgi:flagellar motor switch protein FliN/FliY